MTVDGGNAVNLALPHSAFHPSWSPDSTKIAYSALSEGSANIFVVDAGGGSPALLFSAPGNDRHPSWSPDGGKVIFASDWFAYDFVVDLFITNIDGSHFGALTDGNIFDGVDYLWLLWSPTGARVATTISQVINLDRFITHLGVLNLDGSGLTLLIAAAPWSKSSWSPDGTMIVFTSGTDGVYDVSWVKADGSAAGTIITNGWNPDWQH